MVIWSKLVPVSLAERLDDLPLEKIQGLPLYAKLGIGTVVLGLLAWLAGSRGRKQKIPPGPWGFPFVGAIHQLSDKMFEDCVRLRRAYGDVFSFKLSTSLWVVVNGYPAIKEAFIKNAEDFAGRPNFDWEDLVPFTDPLFMADFDETWKKNKKFALVSLRNFGYGSPRLETKVQEEISQVIEKIKTHNGQSVNLVPYLAQAMAHVIMHVTMFGDRKPTDEETEDLCTLVRKILSDQTQNSVDVISVFLPTWLTKRLFKSYFDEYNNILLTLLKYIKDRISHHKATLDPENPRDALDLYISKRLDKDMTEDDIAQTILIFLPDAIDTLSLSVSTALLYITHHPEVQVKIHEELDCEVGKTGPVTLDHKAKLPYLQATLLEADRIASNAPLAAPHKAICDTTLLGYDIPKDTVMLPNLYSVHFDGDIFPNPDKFDPGHFLNDDGQVKNSEYCIPFSVGRRMCMGEALAKLERYLFVANLYQNFSFSFPPEQPNPPLGYGSSLSGVFYFPAKYQIRAIPRM